MQFYGISRLNFGHIQKVMIIEHSFELCNMMFGHQPAPNLDQNLFFIVSIPMLDLNIVGKAGKEVTLASVS